LPVSFEVHLEPKIVKIQCGAGNVLVLTNSKLVYSWGKNDYHKLGRSNNNNTPLQVNFPNNEGIIEIGAGYFHSLAISESHKLYTWGYGHRGELGIEGVSSSDFPKEVKIQDHLFINAVGNEQNSHAIVCHKNDLKNREKWMLYSWGTTGSKRNPRIPCLIDLPADESPIQIAYTFQTIYVLTLRGRVYSINISDQVTLVELPSNTKQVGVCFEEGTPYYLTIHGELYARKSKPILISKDIALVQTDYQRETSFQMPWEFQKLLWLGKRENDSILHIVPKDIILIIISFCVSDSPYIIPPKKKTAHHASFFANLFKK